MKWYFSILLLFCWDASIGQSGLINTGQLTVLSNTDIVCKGTLTNQNEGNIYNAGTLFLYGNLQNQATQPLFWQSYQNHRGNVVFTGNAIQTISGTAPVKFTRSTISNLFNVDVQVTVFVNDTMSFFTGNFIPHSNLVTFERYTSMGVSFCGAVNNETENSRISGLDCQLQANEYVVFPGITNVAGLGFTLNTNQAISGLNILRRHERQEMAADGSIYRYFIVSGSSFPATSLNFLKLDYHADEFAGLHSNEEDLRLWYSDDEGSGYQKISSIQSPGFVIAENHSFLPGYYTISDENCMVPPACNISGINPICEDDPLQLTASILPASKLHYLWYSPDLLISENDQWNLNLDWDQVAEKEGSLICVKITDLKGCESFDTAVLEIKNKPDATFGFTQFGFCQSEPVVFTGPSGMDYYEWDLGDGMVKTESTFSYSYPTPGDYTITLVTDSNGCRGTFSKTLHIFQNPVAAVEISGNCTGETVLIENNSYLVNPADEISFYQTIIDYGDGQSDSISGLPENNGHIYYLPGEYNLTLAVLTNQGCSDSITESWLVLEKINLSVSAEGICREDTAHIELSLNTYEFNYNWNFGDGNDEYYLMSDYMIGHNYNLAGNYSVSAICSAPGYCSDTAYAEIEVRELPTPLFSSENVCEGEESVFLIETSEIEITSSFWDFGDGQTSGESEPTHLYNEYGLFIVERNVIGINGCESSSSVQYEVYELPVVAISTENVCEGDTTDFSCGTGETAFMFSWDFGDGTQTMQPNLPHIDHYYSTTGLYEVNLTVTGLNGCVYETETPVSVFPNPVIPINENLATCTSSIVADAGNTGSVYLWSTGETSQSVLLNENGSYWVHVTEPAHGCKSFREFSLLLNTVDLFSFSEDTLSCDSITISPGFFSEYLWNNGITGQVNTITETGLYSVTVTDINGCEDFDTIAVQIFYSPEVLSETFEDACYGDTIVFIGDYPGCTFLWNTGSTSSSLNVTSSGNYLVTITGEEGCYSVSETQHAVFYEVPDDPGLADTSVCAGILINPGNEGNTCLWNTGETTLPLFVEETGMYSVTITTPDGCSLSDSAFITIIPSPVLFIGPDIETCTGNPIVVGTDETLLGCTYLWNTGSTSPLISPKISGSYVLTRFETTGCIRTDTVIVEFLPKPEIDFNDSVICSDEGLLLEVPAGLVTDWFDSSGHISEENHIIIYNPGEYFVSVSNSFGCVASDTFFINHTPFVISPQFLVSSTAKAGDTLQFVSVTHPLPGFFLWNFGDGCTSNLEDPEHVYYLEGDFLVTMTIGTGSCTEIYEKTINISGFNKYLVHQIDSAENIDAEYVDFLSAVVYPNPNEGKFVLETVLTNSSVQKALLFDISGQVLGQSSSPKSVEHLQKFSLDEFPSGFYILKVMAGNRTKIFKVIKI